MRSFSTKFISLRSHMLSLYFFETSYNISLLIWDLTMLSFYLLEISQYMLHHYLFEISQCYITTYLRSHNVISLNIWVSLFLQDLQIFTLYFFQVKQYCFFSLQCYLSIYLRVLWCYIFTSKKYTCSQQWHQKSSPKIAI